MKDILITDAGKGKVSISAQTPKAKEVFKEAGCEEGMEGKQDKLLSLVFWAVSHNLSVDSELSITIPQMPFLTREQLTKIFPACPASFLPRTLFPIGQSKFKGDKFMTEETKKWSVNDQFEKGKVYPVYESEGIFVVGKDGKGYKMTPAAWTKIESFNL